MQSFLYDLRYAFRTLRKNPVLTAAALLSLGIGIGANTAIFSLMDRMLFRSLPVAYPERLAMFVARDVQQGFVETDYGNDVSFSWPKYRALREQSGAVFDGLIARFPFDASIASRSQTEAGRGELVSGNYFAVLGVLPAIGRVLTDADTAKRGGEAVAVLSYGYWKRRFGADPSILNQSIMVNGRGLQVVGVAQAGFQSVGAGETPALFIPITMCGDLTLNWQAFDHPHAYWLNIFGRLKPGMSSARAQSAAAVMWRRVVESDVDRLSPGHSAAFREKYLKSTLELQPGAAGISAIRDDASAPLYLLMGMVGLVLLIACANVANLLLGRAAVRGKEMAIRVSLGAGRRRLVQQMLAESVLLSLGGGLIGLAAAAWSGSLLLRLLPDSMPLAGIVADPDGRVLAFTFAISILTGLVFGAVPALRATTVDAAPALQQQAATPSTGGHARFRKILVAGQIALSVLLLASAGVFAHSLYNLESFQPGFRSEGLTEFKIHPRLIGYSAEGSRSLFSELHQAIEPLPGVEAASMAKYPLLTGTIDMSSYGIEGYQPPEGTRSVALHQNQVGAGFFRVMGIPLLAGRDFRASDRAGAPPVAVISETLAHKYFEGRNPLGLHLENRNSKVSYEIVGIARDIKYDDLRERPKPFAYFSAAQDATPGPMTFYVRSALPPDVLARQLRQVVRRLVASLPVVGPKTVPQQIMESVFLDRMVAALASAFAIAATVLAAVGLYGVVAWAVARRRREIGIRMALGAAPANVLRLVLTEVVTLGGIGIAIAVPLWMAAARLFEGLLFGVKSNDALALSSAVAILSSVAAVAGLIPAIRAARIDPVSAIRHE